MSHADLVKSLLTKYGASFTIYTRPGDATEDDTGYGDLSYGELSSWSSATGVMGWFSTQNPLEGLPAGGQVDLYQKILYLEPSAVVKEHDVLADPDGKRWEVVKVETVKIGTNTQYVKLIAKEESDQ